MARRFEFSAQALLRARRQEELSARQALAGAQGHAAQADRALTAAKAVLAELDESARQAVAVGTSGSGLGVYRTCVRNARAALSLRQAEAVAAGQQLRRCRLALADRLKQRKALESVREHQAAAHGRVAARRETDQLDDEHAARTSGAGVETK
ncbi:MAG: flagellar FliJ family protein [Planctomycetota bacterium]|nr:flagellar FliJ family protein [Planctomycetota bacterium]